MSVVKKMFAIAILCIGAPAAYAAAPACFPEDVIPENLFPTVRVETSMGTFDIELNRMRAPVTGNNFLRYVLDGHYDGTIFHRVMPGFVIQGGGYTRNLEERPLRESIINESGNGLKNVSMSVAMARFDDPHSATDQWYVNLGNNESLDPNPRSWGYAVFGTVIAGQDVVEKIAAVETGYSDALDAENVPLAPVLIERVYVLDAN
jgi:peptidyl-prolyl cis-trans isomerase A (cyclophilin A)